MVGSYNKFIFNVLPFMHVLACASPLEKSFLMTMKNPRENCNPET